MLFKTYCMCAYDVTLWSKYTAGCLSKFNACYIKCIKLLFGYNRRDSVTQMLLHIGLPSFNTVMHNCQLTFSKSWLACPNSIIGVLRSLSVVIVCCVFFLFSFCACARVPCLFLSAFMCAMLPDSNKMKWQNTDGAVSYNPLNCFHIFWNPSRISTTNWLVLFFLILIFTY